jgi:hypothetical protein
LWNIKKSFVTDRAYWALVVAQYDKSSMKACTELDISDFLQTAFRNIGILLEGDTFFTIYAKNNILV